MSIITDYFESELSEIQTESIKNFTKLALNNASPVFMLYPASSTGKYHSQQSLGVGGLARHTRATVYFATIFCRSFSIEGKERDKVISAAICHDLEKFGNPPGKYTTKTHSTDCANMLMRLQKENPSMIDKEDVYDIAGMVAAHMGPWEVKAAYKKFPEDYSKAELVVHISDMASAAREVNLNFLQESLIG